MTSQRTGTRGVPRAEREQSILRAATDLFGLHGYANVSVASVAERADVSKALVLSYFESKDRLFLTCAAQVADRLQAPIADAVGSAAPGLTMARSTLRAIFDTLAENPRDWDVLHDSTLPLDSTVATGVKELNRPFDELGALGVTALLGPDADPMDASGLLMVWNGIVASSMAWWDAHPHQSPEQMTDRVGRIMAAVVAQPLVLPD